MFNIKNVHIIETSTKKFTFVGRIPLSLCEIKEPTMADILAMRTIDFDGRTMSYKTPVFDTLEQAIEHCKNNNVECLYKNQVVNQAMGV